MIIDVHNHIVAAVTNTFDEVDRCINELGFVGIMINSDPGEGDGQTPAMGNEYCYPLCEKMVKMDIPGLVPGASCKNPRESFHGHCITEESIAILSLVDSEVFQDFPKLKLIISHGGGSVPYQVGVGARSCAVRTIRRLSTNGLSSFTSTPRFTMSSR
jgi:predicted TIM-barrel fold metal-dependent hydrolase